MTRTVILSSYRIKNMIPQPDEPANTQKTQQLNILVDFCFTFTALLAYSADDKLMIFSYFFPVNRL